MNEWMNEWEKAKQLTECSHAQGWSLLALRWRLKTSLMLYAGAKVGTKRGELTTSCIDLKTHFTLWGEAKLPTLHQGRGMGIQLHRRKPVMRRIEIPATTMRGSPLFCAQPHFLLIISPLSGDDFGKTSTTGMVKAIQKITRCAQKWWKEKQCCSSAFQWKTNFLRKMKGMFKFKKNLRIKCDFSNLHVIFFACYLRL